MCRLYCNLCIVCEILFCCPLFIRGLFVIYGIRIVTCTACCRRIDCQCVAKYYFICRNSGYIDKFVLSLCPLRIEFRIRCDRCIQIKQRCIFFINIPAVENPAVISRRWRIGNYSTMFNRYFVWSACQFVIECNSMIFNFLLCPTCIESYIFCNRSIEIKQSCIFLIGVPAVKSPAVLCRCRLGNKFTIINHHHIWSS